MTATEPLVFSPWDYAVHDDPYPLYTRLRLEAPVYENAEEGFWALSRHADVVEAFRDSTTFSSAQGVSLDPAASGPHAHRTMSFLAMDPPMHGRMRALVSKGFTPRRVAAMEPRIRELTRMHLDDCLERDAFDFVGDFAGKLPMDVISELIGVPEADRPQIRRWSDLLVEREEGFHDVPPAGVEAALELAAYYSEHIAQRRRTHADDLTSALIDAEIDGDRLTDDDLIAFLFLMGVAGNETTTKLLANAWYWAWKNPDQRTAAFEADARIPDWVEETLRFDTSSQLLARVTTTDVELHGATVPAGARVVLLVGSANRDERVFSEPSTYMLGRAPEELQQIVSFGFGRHFCLGASLARLEARVALEELVRSVRVDYDIDEGAARRVHSVNVRGFATLPTTVTAR
jgi:cytochrome P450